MSDSGPGAADEPRLMLLDGHNLAYRSFHAIRDLSRSDGHPTNATFGFLRALDRLRALWHPTHWCVIFDGGLPEARRSALPDYKAQRPPMPDPLRLQLADIQSYLGLARVPWLRQDGEEADDLIATAVHAAAGGGARVQVVSSDKDLAQLCTARVRLISPADCEHDLGPDGVEARLGVPPERVADWLALTGDTSDNIPGVPGIGPKTAARIVTQCPTLDALWDRLDTLDLTPRLRALLAEHRPAVERNRILVALREDLPLPTPWMEWRCRPTPPEARPWLEAMEFRRMADALSIPELF
jgi:DNA polymerase I